MKHKMLSLIIIAFLISSSVIVSSTVSLANAEIAPTAYLASVFQFMFPTPTPTPTPEPTPTPTPKPEPTIWPILDIRCTTSASQSNVKVQVSGTLSYNQTAIPNAPIYIGYCSAINGTNWQNITLVPTRSDGTFGVVWLPPNATDNYILNAHWGGNDTLHWLDAKVNLSLLADSSGNEFSVASNSTIYGFNYDPASQILSFNTNGTTGTAGYMYASIPKALVSDIQSVQVTKDGQTVSYGKESNEDTWVISCVYSQSEHAFVVKIPFADAITPESIPWTVIVVIAAIVILALVVVVVVVRRRRKMAATVASILKESRPSY
ncbi:MAG: hypothetical protein ACQCN4_09690 [Candidatus Bathyarchaeia archaeon]|jgi:hypothetical protein